MATAPWRVALALLALPSAAECQQLLGRVVDENGAPVPHATVSVRAIEGASADRRTRSDTAGRFSLTAPEAGQVLLTAESAGYFRFQQAVSVEQPEIRVTIVLHHVREERQSVEVSDSPAAIDLSNASQTTVVRNEEIVAAPYSSAHLLANALRLTPGAAVQASTGEMHFNGGASHQTAWSLDGFNVADPLTGRLQAPLNVEAVRSATLSSGVYSAEMGKGSAGAMAIQTEMGGDRFRFAASNFVPGVDFRKGFAIGDFRPRLKVSGPIRKGRAWFASSFDGEYAPTVVEELPRGEDRTRLYGLSNLTRAHWNVTDSNILQLGALLSGSNAESAGLGPLDPVQTTRDTRYRQRFLNVKNQKYFRAGLILEAGYAHNKIFGRETPQGLDPLVFTPFGRTGNWFVDGGRWTGRHQWIASVLPPAFTWHGEHQIKAGVDVNSVEYRQDIRRTGFERRGLRNELLRRVTFGGAGRFSEDNVEAAWFVQDSWRLTPALLLELGVRRDWDRLVGRSTTSPRAAFAWAPGESRNLKLSGGFGIVRDATPLTIFARGLDQFRLTEVFDPARGVAYGPLATMFVVDPRQRFRSPRYKNWTLAVERAFAGDVLVRAAYLRRRGGLGFTFLEMEAPPEMSNASPTPVEAVYALANAQRDRFDSLELTLKKDFAQGRSVLVGYTRSRSRSSAAVDMSVDAPSLVVNNDGPTPWDAPNRLMSWAHWPFNSKWTGAYMIEWRTGLPYSLQDLGGDVVGKVHGQRLPDFFEVNVSVERTFALFDRLWAFRVSAVNLFDRANPTVVNNTIGSPDFLTFSGRTSRAFVARIRWLGRR